jgi:hypothetical protein
VLHFEPAYRHARHYIGWARDVDARLAEHLAGAGSPLIQFEVAAGSDALGWRAADELAPERLGAAAVDLTVADLDADRRPIALLG